MTLQHFEDLDTAKSTDSSIIIRCPFGPCNTRIIMLSEKLLSNELIIQNSPDMVQISDNTDSNPNQFFKINDVWDFDNIGVSRPSSDIKQPVIEENNKVLNIKIERLLICSECDKGPIGFAGLEGDDADVKNLKYFLSCSSVLYDIK
ncbi:unnamed protein product [Debaryomyces tyrocola]|nr:unnamed protein product [Debaryomyces tyrocola]